MLADGFDAPRHALDERVVADGERALVFLMERLLHGLDAGRRDREVVLHERRDVHGQLVNLERIVRFHVDFEALALRRDLVAREEFFRLGAELLQDLRDAFEIELRR